MIAAITFADAAMMFAVLAGMSLIILATGYSNR